MIRVIPEAEEEPKKIEVNGKTLEIMLKFRAIESSSNNQ
jgi:hypothetical protein